MNNVTEIKNEKLGESYYEIKHQSGLKILVYPKKNYASSYAMFGTRYGSIDTQFKLSGEKEFTEVPEGIAHFLEHKLFESEDLDAFQRYAATGASANAYTSFDKTCYLFSCSGDFKGSLEILLDFVTHPYFTPETVEKEQGIIVIQSGIEKENRQNVLDEINRQLDIMKNGEFSDEDFEASKKAICDAYRSFNDTPDALDIYYGTQLTGDIVTPDEAIENFLAVTRDDVKKTACALSLDTVYMLAGTDKEDGADE